jgi:hypothetical protein
MGWCQLRRSLADRIEALNAGYVDTAGRQAWRPGRYGGGTHDHQLILVVDNVAKAREVSAAWAVE